MKFCKDCEHYIKRGEWSNYDRCNRKNLIDPSVINDLTKLCYSEREDNWLSSRLEGTCGREGRFYKPRKINIMMNEIDTMIKCIK